VSARRVEIEGGADTGGPFPVGDTLTIYQAAMVYSGRHPGGRFIDSAEYGRASLHDYEVFLGKGSSDKLRALAWYIYCELRRRVEAGVIKPIAPAYMPNGEFDPRDTVIRTADVAAIAWERGESAEYLAPWMKVSTSAQPPRKKRSQPKRDPAKRLILQRYARVPPEEEVPISELYRECLKGWKGVEIERDTFRRARDDLLFEQSRPEK
jgi:hypothetical protein